MKIEFKKIPDLGIDFEIGFENIKFYGKSYKISNNLVKCIGVMEGSFSHLCDRCGEEFINIFKEEIEVYASSGIYEGDDFLNVIEFFDNFVDFDTILKSEIEAYKSDYLYCDKCK